MFESIDFDRNICYLTPAYKTCGMQIANNGRYDPITSEVETSHNCDATAVTLQIML